MPIYEYECPACGRFEIIQKFSDKVLKKCPQCREKGEDNPVTKAVSAAAFHLKGSGWYKTDYSSSKNASSSNEGSSESSAVEKGSAKSEAKDGETKGESKSEAKKEVAPATDSGKKKPCGSSCGCH